MNERFNLGDLTDRSRPADKIALIDCLDWERPREYAHGDIDRLANACARGLLARGCARGDAVAILSANRAEFLIAYLGAMRAGMIAVPVNHKFAPDTIAFVLRDAGVKLALCDRERRAQLPRGMPPIDFDSAAADGFEALLDPGAFEPVRPRPGEIAMVLYTSGSTGRPKGVPLSHDGQLWAVRARLASGKDFDRHRLQIAAPLFHMNGLGTAKFALAAHASLVLLPQFEVARYIEAIERFGTTWLTSVPTMMAMVTRELALLATIDTSRVKLIRMGSAPVTQKLIDDVRRAFPRAQVSMVYGTTEAGPVMFGPHPDGRPKPDLALGWPLPGVEVRIDGAEGSDADQGELWIRTPANMPGYLNLPDRNRAVLTADGWYRSGDVFRRDPQGAYWFVGRTDDMFVCGGENIYPGEVESLLERHPDVVQACVVPVPDEIKHEKPFAFVVRRAGSSAGEDELKRYALAHAPAYQHPRRIVFVDALPLASTNKVDRKALAALALDCWKKGERTEAEA
ncbi:MAG TPA: class I adenylate-forming enzyme family protein [Burkholderiales bacterium]|nr:class I adenylate-forming enzyme family protein [Burkholderiales bacterium]